MRTFILTLLISAFCQNLFGQPSTTLIFNPSHTYIKSYKNIKNEFQNYERVFILDKTDSTYFFRYRTFSGDLRQFATSKGKVVIKNDTIILKTIMPNVYRESIDLNFKNRDIVNLDYIKPLDNDLAKPNEIKVYIAKNDFVYLHSVRELKVFADSNDKFEMIEPLQIQEYKDFNYLTFDKEKYKGKRISMIIDDMNYLINFNEIPYDNFIFKYHLYPIDSYNNFTNYKYRIKGGDFIWIPDNAEYHQWFQSIE